MVQNVSAKQAADWLAAGKATLIDVRSPDEFKTEHIAYAISLPLNDIEGLFAQMHVPVERKIIFQCLKGMRSQQACERISLGDGCNNPIYSLEGGIEAWKLDGLPLVKLGAPKLSIFRQVQIIIGVLVATLVLIGLLNNSVVLISLAGIVGIALATAGLTGWCGLAMLLNKMPWNK